MKFGVGVRIEGKSGEFQGTEGVIQSRLQVGTQTLLVIRWSDGRESRATTGAVRVLAAEGPNAAVVPIVEGIPGPQVRDVEEDGSDDNMSQQSRRAQMKVIDEI